MRAAGEQQVTSQIKGSCHGAHDQRPHFDFTRYPFLIQGSYKIAPLEPIEVGTIRQLLMDDFIVDSTWNCFRHVHEPETHSANAGYKGGPRP